MTDTNGIARYVMIGGFLGAGKTTAIDRFAGELSRRGMRVGLITNDQSAGLVDTALLRSHGFAVEEITGGCFCCRFGSLREAADELTRQTRPEVFLAEPVGSCTDLLATVSYPLRRLYGDRFRIAPLSVLVDPIRAARILGLVEGRSFSPKVVYVYRKQLEEAEFIVLNKCDQLEDELPGVEAGNRLWSSIEADDVRDGRRIGPANLPVSRWARLAVAAVLVAAATAILIGPGRAIATTALERARIWLMGTSAGDQPLPVTSIEARAGDVVYEFLLRGDTVRIVHPTGDTTLMRHLSPVAIQTLGERLMAGVELRVVPAEGRDSSTTGPMAPYVFPLGSDGPCFTRLDRTRHLNSLNFVPDIWGAPQPNSWMVHRRLRHWQPQGRQDAVGRAQMT